MVYISAFAISCLFAYVYQRLNKRSINTKFNAFLCAALSLLPVLMLAMLRKGTGADYWNYTKAYIYDYTYNFEPLVVFLIHGLKKITNEPQAFFVISSIIIYILYYFGIFRESDTPSFSVFLFLVSGCFFMTMNLIRQSMAIGIGLLSLPYIKDQKLKPVIIITFVAAMCHYSAVFYLLLYIMNHFKISPLQALAICFLVFVFSSVIALLLSYFLQGSKYSGYFSLAENNIRWSSVLVNLSVFILLSYMYSFIQNNPTLKLLYTTAFLGMLFCLSCRAMPEPVGRLSEYSNMICVIYLPHAIKSLHDKRIRTLVYILAAILYILEYIWYISGDWYKTYFIYKTVFQY